MQQQVLGDSGQFWMSVIERLNAEDHLYHPLPDILKDTCDFFDYGCGFIYQCNQGGRESVFYLRDSYVLYKHNHLPDPVNLSRMAGQRAMEELVRRRSLVYTCDRLPSETECRFASIFNAQSLVLVPVCDQGRVAALVGMADRRSSSRKVTRSAELVYSILNAVANHVKLQLYEDRVARTEKSLVSIIDNMGVEVYVNDFYTHELLYVNRSMAAPLGGADRLMGKPCWQTLCPGTEGQCAFCPLPMLMDEGGRPVQTYTWDRHCEDDTWYHCVSGAFQWVDGRLAHVMSRINITENKRNEALVRQLADYDPLTGLQNRRRLVEVMERDLAEMAATGEEGYVIFMDLDGFKEVNDTHGHRAGDAILEQVGLMLRSDAGLAQRSFRCGGDEFVVLVRGGVDQVADTLRTLGTRFSLPWQLGDVSVWCGCSFGVSHYPGDSVDPEFLLHAADKAMYLGKQTGGGQVLFYNNGNYSAIDDFCGFRTGLPRTGQIPSGQIS